MKQTLRVLFIMIIWIAVALLFAVPQSRASVIAGPIINPANGHLYYLLSNNTWTASEAEAVTLGGHLATIRNVAENDWINKTFSNYGGVARNIRIGLNDLATAGTFVWVSGEISTYRNWSTGQPDNKGTERCGEIGTTGMWNNFTDAATDRYGMAEVIKPLSSLTISAGPSSVIGNEINMAGYTATATFSDNSNAVFPATWSVSPATYASIESSGILTTQKVPSNQTITVTATVTVDGVTKTATRTVTIVKQQIAGTVYFSDDFENGLDKWEVSGQDWAIVTTESRGGSHCITDSPSGNYTPNANSIITLNQTLNLSSSTAPILTFWHKYFTQSGADLAKVDISQDFGLTWKEIASYTGNSATWSKVTLDFTPYKLKPILIRFRVVSDGPGTQLDGWYVDDVEIKESETNTATFPFFDDFESGLGNWIISGHDWGVTDTDYRSGGHSITDSPAGNYPVSANNSITLAHPLDLSKTISPVLSFWHKYSIQAGGFWGAPDYAYVEISKDGGVSWAMIPGGSFNGTVSTWTKQMLDLTTYKGSSVLIRFRLQEDPGYGQADGWYIDDIQIKEKDTLTTAFPFFDNFENGLGNWEASGLDWALTDADFRSTGHSITDSSSGNYLPNTNSTLTLIHPINLSASSAPILSFWHKYFTQSGADLAKVDISQDFGLTWKEIASYTGNSATWSKVTLDFTPYKSKPILIRFRVVSDGPGTQSDGWYVDDVEIKEKDAQTTHIPFFDNFENGLDNWVVSGRDWGLTASYYRSTGHSITDSPTGDYPISANSSITLAHPFDLSGTTSPVLSFWHKYSIQAGGFWGAPDYAYVEISKDGGISWAMISGGSFNGTVSTWTKQMLDLTTYKGSSVLIRFRLQEDPGYGQADGWYIDDVEIKDIGVVTYTITTTAGSNGSITSTQIVNSGSNSVPVVITPLTGYHIVSISVDSVAQTIGDPKNFSITFSKVTSNHTVSATFDSDGPINGVCGTSDKKNLAAIPATNLCTTGSESTVVGNGPWSWSCNGSNGGTDAVCSTNSTDITLPTITAFALPATSNNLTVTITTFTASDNVAVSSYCLTETNNAGGCSWNSTKPVSYIFSADGTKTLYAFARDAAGNISTPGSAPVIITIPAVVNLCGISNKQTLTAKPATGLCNSGTASTVSGSGPWTWSCGGASSGTSASCSADIASYTVTATAGSGGGITPVSRTINHGATASFTVTPAGNNIAKVSGCGGTLSGSTFTTGIVTADCTLTALFGASQYAVSATVTGGNGAVSCTNPVNSGSSSACIIAPAAGYRLASFVDNSADKTGSVSGSSYSIVNVTANHTITASFALTPDTTPPTVAITDPADNSTNEDVWQLSASASDAIGVTTVDFSVTATISGSTYYLNSGNTFTKTTAPTWISASYDTSGGVWIRDTQLVNWSDNKTYTVTARARDASGNEKTATSTFIKVVRLPKDPSVLSLDLSASSIANSGTITISGILSRFCSSGDCPSIDLQNRKVRITIRTEANSIVHQKDYITSDAAGHFSSGQLSIFGTSGSYTVQATYAGETDLQKSTSTVKTLLVGKPAGYAVIIQGKIASGEGLAEHSKSTRRIYQTLKERNFTDDNIYWFNYGTVSDTSLTVDDTTPTITRVGNILSGATAFTSSDGQTLAQRMSTNPAPLYVIMVDHGSPDQFHLSDGDITPSLLDGWLTALDTNITTTAARTEKKIIIIGACYSGSFIKQPLSRTGRIIIASASRGEVSYRGGFDSQDTLQSGEYFLDELFASFKRLNDIKTAFKEASEKTWQFTRKGGIPNSNGPFTNASQHPLLDDNGDGSGSIILSDGSGDGINSKGVYLGVSPGKINSLSDPADLSSVKPTIYLESGQTTNIPALWATASNPSQVSSVYVELLRPTDHLTATSGTGQIRRPIDPAQAMTATNNRFEYNDYTFGASTGGYGKYEAYYYAIDKETGSASPSKRSLVYRDKPANTKPTAPVATEPDMYGLVPDPANPGSRIFPEPNLMFQWNESTDPDGDPLTYTLEICTDNQFTTGCKTFEEIVSTTRIVEGLTPATTYYWRVWSVDSYTRSEVSSETRNFTPKSANPLLTIIRGQVIAAENPSQCIAGAQIILTMPGYLDRIAVSKVDGSFEYLAIPLVPSLFEFSLTASRESYTSATIPVSIIPTGTSINQLIPLTTGAAPVTTTTKAKIYLGSDDTFIISNSGATLYGNTGSDTVTLADGASGIILDQNVERVNLPGTANSYQFKQTGNKINMYDAAGTTLLVTIPVQGDSDGTQLSFSNGTATARLTAGIMTLGEAAVSATATPLAPILTTGTPTPATATKAKVFLGNDDIFTVSNSGAIVYGSSGVDTVTIAAGISGVTLDQNVERLTLPGTADSYTFKQTGNKLNIYDASGVTKIVTIPVQGDADGTLLSFDNGSTASALLANGVMTVGGKTVPQ